MSPVGHESAAGFGRKEWFNGGGLALEFAFSEQDFRHLAQLAYDYAGISLSDSKRNLVYSRLSRRLRELRLSSFAQYRDLLESNEREIENFINSISTNHTKFFREAHHLDHLRTHVVVPFAQGVGRGLSRRLRIWSAGCSTGEEPYSIAVVLKREIRDFGDLDVRILATDIDTDVLAKAARAEFAASATDDVPKPYQQFFKPLGRDRPDKVTVDEDVRALVTFRRLNLIEAWPFRGHFDAIFCRNVMIYFDAATKSRLIDRLSRQLTPNGWLYIGHSESLIGLHPELQLVGRTIYRRVA
jgi:chemotaxis protein methyltransferase CheR